MSEEPHPQHEQSFSLLGEILALKKENPLWLVVCGGSALQAHGIITRATKDVDVFALRNELEGLTPAYPFGESLIEAIQQVATTLNLPPNWLNTSVSFLQSTLNDYPDYFWQNLKEQEYGSHLRISYLSTKGLITLKTLAVIQRDAPRDLEDLQALQPTETEITTALQWCQEKTPDPDHAKIQLILTSLHYESLIPHFLS